MTVRFGRQVVIGIACAVQFGVGVCARAGECTPGTGPDVIVGDLSGWAKWGTLNNISAYSFGTVSCNLGDEVLPWIAANNQHPVIAQNAYRLKDGRFEQIGMAWVKHGWGALTDNVCCICINPNNFEALGIGCSDPYDAGLNGDQNGFPNGGGTVAGLGPRSEINASSGVFAFPYGTQGVSGNVLYKRLQIKVTDLDPALNAGALYFAEAHYITPHDAQSGNGNNNASYRRFTVGSMSSGSYTLSFGGSFATEREKPAIQAWQDHDPDVVLQTVDVPDDGRYIIGYKVSRNARGAWTYEYALYNMNSHRSARSFAVPAPGGINISNIGFHDVDYHSGELFDFTDWAVQNAAGSGILKWTGDAFEVKPNANALRWGTLYNCRFEADAPPGLVNATLGLFKPGNAGSPTSMTVPVLGPVKPGDINGSGAVDVDDLLAVINGWGPCPAPPDACAADIAPVGGGDGAVDVDDLLMVINNWG